MKSSIPLVSVCVPAFNRGELLRVCLWSILRQSMREFELIVVDNNSEEDLRRIALSFNDLRVKYYKNDKNFGPNFSFKRAAGLATGKYLKFVCSDDLLLPNCLEESIKEIELYPGASALVFKSAQFSETGITENGSYRLPWSGLAVNLSVSDNLHVYKFVRAGPTEVIFRRQTLSEIGGFTPKYDAIGDWELYARMLQKGGGVVFFDRVLALCRIHADRDSYAAVSDMRFLSQSLSASRHGPEGKAINVWGEIWRQLSQNIHDGRSIVPVVSLVREHGYLGGFLLRFPFMAARRLLARCLPRKTKSSPGRETASLTEEDKKLESFLIETRAVADFPGP